MLKNKVYTIFGVFVFSFFWVNICAAFGVSPPWIKNYNLLPGSHIEEEIILSRSDPDEDLKAKVIYALPEEMADWVSLDKGDEFLLPKGEMRIPVKVTIDVPQDARLGRYKGGIKIETIPDKEGAMVGIAIALGIEIDLEVVNKEIEGMVVRYLNMAGTFVEGKPIVLLMRIENTGNVQTRPDKVVAEFYDKYRTELLTTVEDNDVGWISSFATQEIFAEFPAKFKPGTYWTNIKIYKNDEMVREDWFIFDITERNLPFLLEKLDENKLYILSGLAMAALFFVLWKMFSKKFKIVKVGSPTGKPVENKKKESDLLSRNQDNFRPE